MKMILKINNQGEKRLEIYPEASFWKPILSNYIDNIVEFELVYAKEVPAKWKGLRCLTMTSC